MNLVNSTSHGKFQDIEMCASRGFSLFDFFVTAEHCRTQHEVSQKLHSCIFCEFEVIAF